MSGRAARVVGVFPHPDDEAYAAGGTLALCAAHGASVTVICMTRGERGRDRHARTPPGDDLADLRCAELEQSCRALGIGPPRILGLPDGQVHDAWQAPHRAQLLSWLDELEANVVITLGEDGVYGHPDHLATTRHVDLVAANRRVLHAQFPSGLFDPVHRMLRGVLPMPERQLGIRVANADLRVAIGEVRDRKLAALSAHRSQLKGGDPHTFLRPGLIDALLDEEWFSVRSGPRLPAGARMPWDGL